MLVKLRFKQLIFWVFQNIKTPKIQNVLIFFYPTFPQLPNTISDNSNKQGCVRITINQFVASFAVDLKFKFSLISKQRETKESNFWSYISRNQT
jgi:hypothetical protein